MGKSDTAGLGENLRLTSISSRRLRSRNTCTPAWVLKFKLSLIGIMWASLVMAHVWLQLNSYKNVAYVLAHEYLPKKLFPDLKQRKETLQIWAFLTLLLTHCLDSLGICQIISDYLAHLWEMPAIPLTTTHDVVIKLLVQVIKKRNGLHNHGVNLIWAELEFVAWQAKTNNI